MKASDAKCSNLWGYALADCILKINIIPSQSEDTSPYMIWYGHPYDVSSYPILTFGCKVMAHVAVESQSKLSDNAEITYYVGQTPHTKYSILLYNKSTKKIITRRTFRVVQNDTIGTRMKSPQKILIDPIDVTDALPSPIHTSVDTNMSINIPYDMVTIPSTDNTCRYTDMMSTVSTIHSPTKSNNENIFSTSIYDKNEFHLTSSNTIPISTFMNELTVYVYVRG
jgi:hypothetical protein